MSKYQVRVFRYSESHDWRVESIDERGRVEVTVFPGSGDLSALMRARDYAEWKYDYRPHDEELRARVEEFIKSIVRDIFHQEMNGAALASAVEGVLMALPKGEEA